MAHQHSHQHRTVPVVCADQVLFKHSVQCGFQLRLDLMRAYQQGHERVVLEAGALELGQDLCYAMLAGISHESPGLGICLRTTNEATRERVDHALVMRRDAVLARGAWDKWERWRAEELRGRPRAMGLRSVA